MNITEMEATLRAIHTLSKHDQGDHGHHGPWGHICKACTKWERAEGWREGRKGNSAYMHEISIPVRENTRRTGSIQLVCQVKKQKVQMTTGQ